MTGRERREREKSWGTRVAEKREAMGISQAQLGELCRPPLTQQTISKIEHNAIVPRIQTMESIAKALGGDVDEFFPWASRPKPKAAAS